MPMTEKEFLKRDAKRDTGAELLESVKQIKRNDVRIAYSSAVAARQKVGMSQAHFALLLGVSVRTLQGWEQGRIESSGAAKTLLKIAQTNPDALRAVAYVNSALASKATLPPPLLFGLICSLSPISFDSALALPRRLS